MALSKIWSAFILVAVAVALANMLFIPGNKDIFNRMVVGKAGDTSQVVVYDSSLLPQNIAVLLGAGKDVKQGNRHFVRTAEGRVVAYREQTADGILATCKASVEICIGLIGIMALFMGFMSIAEKAGGIRFLSRIIGPFFSKLFPGLPANHPAFGHMMLNFSANLLGLDNAATTFGI